MKPVFISTIAVIQHPGDWDVLKVYLQNVGNHLMESFTDFEIILIQNIENRLRNFDWSQIPPDIRKNIFLLKLSNPVNRNHAILAGLDRANGDYSLVFGLEMHDHAEMISKLYQKTQEGFDIVYLKSEKRKQKGLQSAFRNFFYKILHSYSQLRVDPDALDTRIISRRALNSLLKLRENLRFMKAIYSIVGFPTASLKLEAAPEPPEESFSENFRTSLVAITSFTTFLRSLSLWIFLVSVLIAAIVIVNAFMVKIWHTDIFGTPQEALSGWAFTIVAISIFFSITFLNLYLITIFLSNIYHEIKNRPLYIIESINRV
ncbi:MAG: hypothetical protein R2879_05175 [Saprospiraceae bacterium]